ncbi:hypothetical protein RchiOBHm_Chr3g0476891 [Rosa chinensis]|uniref:Uncharacterized protein n=1 Tax=Rosa chinensis TaxID=74649 RepID=A0A2P6RCS3_ROSCH|nr:uncharacterized protein LOC112192637 [Rosa chinensis]PRQ44227.1 hypothetical protein RchiOBHm_Chr3g0476891 [Rosa chinensis]
MRNPTRTLANWTFEKKGKRPKSRYREREMAMPWNMTLWMAEMVWLALTGWVSSCLTVADELATSLRTGDIGPFNVG